MVGGGKCSRGEDDVRRQGECQAKHSEVAAAQVRADRDNVLVDHIVEMTNALIIWLTDNTIYGFVGKIIHNFIGRV